MRPAHHGAEMAAWLVSEIRIAGANRMRAYLETDVLRLFKEAIDLAPFETECSPPIVRTNFAPKCPEWILQPRQPFPRASSGLSRQDHGMRFNFFGGAPVILS